MKNPYYASAALIQGATWIPARLIFGFFCKFTVRGLENIENLPSPLIFAPNHASETDPTLVRYALPLLSRFAPLFYPVRETPHYKSSAFGWRRFIYGGGFFRAMGALPIRSGLKDYSQSLALYVHLLKRGCSVCIFPEGRMTKTGVIGEAHGGVSYLANETHLPVIPVSIKGTYRLGFKDLLTFRRTIIISFGKPLQITHPGNPPIEWYKEKAGEIMSSVKELLAHP